MVSKCPLAVVFVVILFVGVLAVLPYSLGQTGTSKSGIIPSDETWTKTGSPYNLVGPIAVVEGVTLNVEPGVTINLNSYYMQVNGTLTAIGSSSDPIHINGGSSYNLLNPMLPSGPAGLTFYPQSLSWNEQTGSGSTIQNAIFNSTQVEVDSSLKIADITGAMLIIAGNPLITGNSQISMIIYSGTPTITNNNLSNQITVYRGSPIITNNQFTLQGGTAIFLGYKYGLLKTDAPFVSGNTILGTFTPAIFVTGSATVQNNLIVSSNSVDSNGIAVNGGEDGPGNITIQYNTVVGCNQGLDIDNNRKPNI